MIGDPIIERYGRVTKPPALLLYNQVCVVSIKRTFYIGKAIKKSRGFHAPAFYLIVFLWNNLFYILYIFNP